MYARNSRFGFVIIVLFVLTFLLAAGNENSFAQVPKPGSAPLMFEGADDSANSVSDVQYIFNDVRSHTFLRSDGSAVRLKEITIQNNSFAPLESNTWCYYWGQDNGYTNIFAEDSEGYLDVQYYMYNSPTYGWGLCIRSDFRSPLQSGETYSYSHGVTIGNHNSVYGDVIYAWWWTNPVFAQNYVEDVRWPFNHEGVVADPQPDVLNPAQALWYRTNQDGIFTINLQITLGDTMAVVPLSQGTNPFNGEDIPWENDAYGVNTGQTIGDLGCFLTDAAMSINYFAGILGLTGDIDPGELNTWLAQPNDDVPSNPPRGYGFCGPEGGYCLVSRTALAAASEALFDATGPIIQYVGYEEVQSIDDFRDNLQNGQLGILNVDNGGYNHFVLVTGITAVDSTETLSINDPFESRGSTTLYDQYNNNHEGSVRWFSAGDESVRGNYVLVQANSPLHLLITDQYGRRSGFDPVSQVSYDEIAESSYYGEYPPDVLFSEAEEIKVFEAHVLEKSSYTIQAIGTGSGPFTLTFQGVTDSGDIDIRTVTGHIEEGEAQTFEIEYDPNEGLVEYDIYLPYISR